MSCPYDVFENVKFKLRPSAAFLIPCKARNAVRLILCTAGSFEAVWFHAKGQQRRYEISKLYDIQTTSPSKMRLITFAKSDDI